LKEISNSLTVMTNPQKVAVITGGNGSVGMGIAKRLLLEHDVKVYLVCRNLGRGNAAKEQLIEECFPQDPNRGLDNIEVVSCDLSSVKSVFECCKELKNLRRLDYLILNAGIMPSVGIDLWTGIKNLLTRPSYVAKTGGDIIIQRKGDVNGDGLGTVFAANVFGHFIMVPNS
jgi:17beta-estradiol 17-dehydrogenase/3beta-hydroxysteroid 3-dehydrogenase